jgi:glutamate dehydrogenase
MYLEIDRCANAAELNVLSKELEQVLAKCAWRWPISSR